MKAIRAHQFGAPELLRLDEAPTTRPGQLLVKLHAIGVKRIPNERAGVTEMEPLGLLDPTALLLFSPRQ